MSTESLLKEIRQLELEASVRLEELRTMREGLTGEMVTQAPVVSLAEFRNENLSDFSWLISGVLTRGGLSILASDSGLGKSTLLVQLTLCLSAGRDPFAGLEIPRRAPTLYIAAEGSRGAFQARVETARRVLGIDCGVGWFIQKERTTDFQIGSPTLEAMIARSRAELVIMDTLGYFWGGDENSAVEWKQGVVLPLLSLQEKHGCAFMIVHHHGKASEYRKGAERVRGTTAMKADADQLFQLDLVDSEPAAPWRRLLTQTKNRFGRTGEWVLEFDAENARFK